MDELFTSEVIYEEEGDQASFTSGDSNNETYTGFQEYEANATAIEMPDYGEAEQWGDESYTIYYPPYADGSAITESGELFTSSPNELPDQTTITGSEGPRTENEGTVDTRENTTAQTTEDLETKEILRAILNKIPETKADEETTTTTTEEETETTTDGYIYELSNIKNRLSEMQDRQEIGIKNSNLVGLSGIMLISALLGTIFINMLLGRMR